MLGLLLCRLTSPRLVRHKIMAGAEIMRVVDRVRKDINIIITLDSRFVCVYFLEDVSKGRLDF